MNSLFPATHAVKGKAAGGGGGYRWAAFFELELRVKSRNMT